MVNLNKIFKERQEELVLIANSPIGRFLLGVTEKKLPVVAISPNAVIFKIGNWVKNKFGIVVPEFYGEFFAGFGNNVEILKPLPYIDTLRDFHPKYSPVGINEFIKAVEHYSGYTRGNFPTLFLDGPTDFEAATGGTAGIYAANATYSTARSASTASGAQQAIGNDAVAGYEITRWFCPTDFSTIAAGSDVTATNGYLYPTGRNTTTDDTGKFILTTQASTSAIANDDFDNLTLNSPTTYGTSGAYSSFTLNQYSAAIAMTAGFQTLVEAAAGVGFVKMGMRATGDIDNTTPTTRSFLNFSQSNGQRTKFAITWTPPSAAGAADLSYAGMM